MPKTTQIGTLVASAAYRRVVLYERTHSCTRSGRCSILTGLEVRPETYHFD